MWVAFAFASAFFSGLTAILAKIGIKNIDSNLATAIRTIVILLFTWLIVFSIGSQTQVSQIDRKTLVFLILSGFATGGSWLFYFKALQLADVNKVAPLDKSSVVLTMVLGITILGENVSLAILVGLIGIAIGTYLMVKPKLNSGNTTPVSNKWILYAVLSAVFASLTAILGKVGIQNIESNLGTAIRTIVVCLLAWAIVLATKKIHDIPKINKKSLVFLILSGFTTGLAWLSYYRALQTGPASVIVPIDKLSIVLTVLFAYIVLREKLSKTAFVGLLFIIIGTLALLF